MRKRIVFLSLAVAAAGCQGAGTTVLEDFGLKDRPGDYVSGTDRAFMKLDEVGAVEMERLNLETRHGEVKFEEEQGIRGRYYKERKIYERYFPLDAQATSRNSMNDSRGYVGYIDYEYEIYQSERKNNRTEAAAETAAIPTGERGRERFRYRLNTAGEWDGAKGTPTTTN